MTLTLLGQTLLHTASVWIPARALEGYAFGVAFQSALMIAMQMKEHHNRHAAFSRMVQAALIATIVGPVFGGALGRIAGTTLSFGMAALAAAAATWCATYIRTGLPFPGAVSVVSMMENKSTRTLAIPLLGTGIANRFIWFTAVGLFLPIIGASRPLGVAAVGEAIGMLGIGMFVCRRLIDKHIRTVSINLGWACNVACAALTATGFFFNVSVFLWMPLAFSVGMLLTTASRVQQDWIVAQPASNAAGLQAVSRLADRFGALLAGIFIAPTMTMPASVPCTILLMTVILLCIVSKIYRG